MSDVVPAHDPDYFIVVHRLQIEADLENCVSGIGPRLRKRIVALLDDSNVMDTGINHFGLDELEALRRWCNHHIERLS